MAHHTGGFCWVQKGIEHRLHFSGRQAALHAARDEFYKGSIAETILAYHRRNGGLLTADDMASFVVNVESPPCVRYKGYDVYACGAWCQGSEMLRMEKRIPDAVVKGLTDKGHRVELWPDWAWKAGGVCLITIDREQGVLTGAPTRAANPTPLAGKEDFSKHCETQTDGPGSSTDERYFTATFLLVYFYYYGKIPF